MRDRPEIDEIFKLNSSQGNRHRPIRRSEILETNTRQEWRPNLDLPVPISKSNCRWRGFDVAISVQSMHHFGQNKSYRSTGRFSQSSGNGTYIEADYVVGTAIEEMELLNR